MVPMLRSPSTRAALLGSALLCTPLSAQSGFAELRRMIPTDVAPSLDVDAADIDADGDVDALFTGGRARLYRNDGSGVLLDASELLPDPDDATTCGAIGDVDGDLDPDILLGKSGHPGRLLLFGNEDGALFGPGAPIAEFVAFFAPALPEALELGDVDRDGDLDLVVGGGSVPTKLLVNDGSGGFVEVLGLLPAIAKTTRDATFADLDGDGDLDLLLAHTGAIYEGIDIFGTTNGLYRNDGSGVFADASADLPPNQDSTFGVAVGDVDGDDDLDVFFATRLSGFFDPAAQNRLYLNDGRGVFGDATASLPVLDDLSSDAVLDDLDGDGHVDILVLNAATTPAAGLNRFLHNLGGGVFVDETAAYPFVPELTEAGVLVDLDGDEDLDLLLANFAQQSRVFLGDGAGLLVESTAGLPASAAASRCAGIADLDGDLDLDLLIGDDGSDRLYLNDGTGVFADASAALPGITSSTAAVALADLDGDGDRDAVLAGGLPPGTPDRIYLNDGRGSFTDVPGALPATAGWSRAVAVGDVDGDLDPDLVIGKNFGQNRLYLNDGTGAFTDGTALLPVAQSITTDLALGDVDGDLDLDVVSSSSGSIADVNLYLNTGAGFVEASSRLPSLTGSTNGLALGDVDGDLDLDIWSVTGAFSPSHLYLNDGAGFFTDASFQILSASLGVAQDVALGDLDRDGDLDAVVVHAFGADSGSGDATLLFRNDGGGVFTPDPALPGLGADKLSVSLGDLDGDGDTDVVIPGYFGQDRVLMNLEEQLAHRAIPRIDELLSFDLRGAPSGVWFLVLAPGTGHLELPGIEGAYELSILGSFLLASGFLDPNGAASTTLFVPDDATLVGAALHWQALVSLGTGFGFTNRDRTEFTGL